MPDRGLVPRRVGATLVVSGLVCLVSAVLADEAFMDRPAVAFLLLVLAIVLAINGVVLWRTARELAPVEEPQRSDWE